MAASILEHFSSLIDPRIGRCKQHGLIDIIVLTLSAVASGADGWGTSFRQNHYCPVKKKEVV